MIIQFQNFSCTDKNFGDGRQIGFRVKHLTLPGKGQTQGGYDVKAGEPVSPHVKTHGR